MNQNVDRLRSCMGLNMGFKVLEVRQTLKSPLALTDVTSRVMEERADHCNSDNRFPSQTLTIK